METKRTYYQCDCDNPKHTKDAHARWDAKMDNKTILDDCSTMIITVDGVEAHCQCVYCGYDEIVDISLKPHAAEQYGKRFSIGKMTDMGYEWGLSWLMEQ